MVEHLFVYGMLRDPQILRAVLGRRPDRDALVPAEAPGMRAVYMPGRVYPGLVEDAAASTPGMLIRGLSEEDHAMLDAFKGPEFARRRIPIVSVEPHSSAHTHVPRDPVPADAPHWRFEDWTARHKPAIITAELAAIAVLRARLKETDHDSVSTETIPGSPA